MGPVVRLVTVVDVEGDVANGRRMSVHARHEAELADGRRVLLLDDRGWSASGPPDVWATTSVEDVTATARTVVGPDEPFGDRSASDMAADHWDWLAGLLERAGVDADAAELSRLPHDVLVGDRLRSRLGSGDDPAGARR